MWHIFILKNKYLLKDPLSLNLSLTAMRLRGVQDIGGLSRYKNKTGYTANGGRLTIDGFRNNVKYDDLQIIDYQECASLRG